MLAATAAATTATKEDATRGGAPIETEEATTVGTTEAPSVDALQKKTQPGYAPQPVLLQSESIPPEVCHDMFQPFLTQRKSVSVYTCCTLLNANTQAWLSSIADQRRQRLMY